MPALVAKTGVKEIFRLKLFVYFSPEIQLTSMSVTIAPESPLVEKKKKILPPVECRSASTLFV